MTTKQTVPPATFRDIVTAYCADNQISQSRVIRDHRLPRSAFYNWMAGTPIPEGAQRRVATVFGVDPELVRRVSGVAPRQPGPAGAGRQHTSAYGEMVLSAASDQGLSIADLVRRSQIGRSSLYSAIAGRSVPSPDQIKAVADVLGLDPVELGRTAGEPVEFGADVLRLQMGLSRTAYAQRHNMVPELLFSAAGPARPDRAYQASLLHGATGKEAAAAAGRARDSNSTCPLGDIIEACLNRRGITTATLAAELRVSRQSVEQWITGATQPSRVAPIELAYALGVEVRLIHDAIRQRVNPFHAQGAVLKRLRTNAGLLQREVAAVLEMSPSVVSSFESGTRRIPAHAAATLHQVYGWDLDRGPQPTVTPPAPQPQN